ncbi:hypothetical protein [Mesorhizobium muleiense]|nr:hypothetical protein [Mesorhizobium muleiense]
MRRFFLLAARRARYSSMGVATIFVSFGVLPYSAQMQMLLE